MRSCVILSRKECGHECLHLPRRYEAPFVPVNELCHLPVRLDGEPGGVPEHLSEVQGAIAIRVNRVEVATQLFCG